MLVAIKDAHNIVINATLQPRVNNTFAFEV